MLTRIIWGKVTPGSWDKFEATYRDVIAKAPRIDGLRGRWLLRDANDPDAGFSISVWENERKMQAYETGDFIDRVVNPSLRPFFAGDFITHHCEVRVSESFPTPSVD